MSNSPSKLALLLLSGIAIIGALQRTNADEANQILALNAKAKEDEDDIADLSTKNQQLVSDVTDLRGKLQDEGVDDDTLAQFESVLASAAAQPPHTTVTVDPTTGAPAPAAAAPDGSTLPTGNAGDSSGTGASSASGNATGTPSSPGSGDTGSTGSAPGDGSAVPPNTLPADGTGAAPGTPGGANPPPTQGAGAPDGDPNATT